MPDSKDRAPGSAPVGLLCFVVAGVAFVLAVVAIPARATYGAQTTADEPQYLTTALSLANDFDLDISDEIEHREFEPFHELTLNEQTFPLDEAGKRISPHDPLLPLYLAPFMAVGGWEAAKVGLAILSALTASTTFWVVVRRFEVAPILGAFVVIIFWAGVPLSAYGTQVYPEMPAALFVVWAIAVLASKAKPTIAGSALVWLCVVGLPWLAVKYAPVAIVLALTLLARLWTRPVSGGTRRGAAIATVAWALSGVAYLALHQKIYGGWTVYASGDHFVKRGEFAVVGSHPDYFGRSRRLVGLLVDRRFGIATWHPVWFVAPFAMTWLASRDRAFRVLVLPTFVAGLFTATFVALTMQGWWFPGRQMVVVLPLAVLAVAKLANEFRAALVLVLAGGIAGVVNYLTLVNESSNGERTMIVDHWEVQSAPYRAIYRLMPDGLSSGTDPIVGLAIWGVLLVVSMMAGARLGGVTPSSLASVCHASWAARPTRNET